MRVLFKIKVSAHSKSQVSRTNLLLFFRNNFATFKQKKKARL